MGAVVNIYLLWGAWTDLRTKTISDQYLWLGGITGILYSMIKIMAEAFVWEEQMIAYVPGFIILTIAKITNEKIGYGDGWIILILGSFLGIYEIYRIFQFAVILTAAASVILLCIKKEGREYKIPFLPFLWAAYTCQWGMRYV